MTLFIYMHLPIKKNNEIQIKEFCGICFALNLFDNLANTKVMFRSSIMVGAQIGSGADCGEEYI